MKETNYLTFSGKVMRTSEKAVLIDSSSLSEHIGNRNTEIWIPKSVMKDAASLEAGDKDVRVAEWWVEKQMA